jgi:hypothetical protein
MHSSSVGYRRGVVDLKIQQTLPESLVIDERSGGEMQEREDVRPKMVSDDSGCHGEGCEHRLRGTEEELQV